MANEPEGTQGAEDPQPNAEAPDYKQRADDLTRELESMRAQLGEYQNMILDPRVVAALASIAGQPSGTTRTAAPSKEEEADWDTLTPKQQFELMRKTLRTDLAAEIKSAVGNLQAGSAVEASVAQVKAAAAAHSDYWSYKKEMLVLAGLYPDWTAEKVYEEAKLFAKTRKSESSTSSSEKTKPATRSESPTATTPSKTTPKPKGFQQAFQQAWKEHVGKTETL